MVEEDTRAMAAQAGQASVDPVQASDGPHASEVSATVSQDGGDGDDELDEDDSGEDEDDDEQEVEEEEEEPRLKYQRLGGSVPGIVSSSGASCLTVAERIIALGSSDGTVHLLDYQGNQVKEFAVHTAAVNELSFDAEGEYIASCSDDGTVVVSSLYTDDKERHEYHRPVKAVALDPEYGKKSSKQIVSGGLAGQLIVNSKGWLGARDQVLHSGEGPIHAIKWRGSLVAWANNLGVKLYDTSTQQRLSFIERPPASPRPELVRPHIVWQDDTIFVIGWADCVKVAAVRTRGGVKGVVGVTAGALSADLLGRGRKVPFIEGMKYVEIIAVFTTEYFISGLAPYGDALVVLAYVPPGETASKGQSKVTTEKQGGSNWPEVHIVTLKNEELASDALSVLGYEHCEAKDYSLAHAPFVGSSGSGGQWVEGYEPLYFVVSPKDVVVARPRDAEDHVAWLLQHGWYEKALEAVEAGNGRKELFDEVGSRYLDHLVLERQYDQAAALCPKLLRGSATAWERWIFNFAQLRQLPKLAPYVPIANPRLKDSVYEVVLNSLLINPAYHDQLLTTIRAWPNDLYSAKSVIDAVELQMKTSLRSPALQEVLLTLYLMEKQQEKAFVILLELQKRNAFDFIEQNNLYGAIRDKVIPLMELDGKRAVSLYIQQSDSIPASEVVPQLLKAAKNDEQFKPLLHSYLHALFEKDPNAGKNFHYLQVELYAQYEPRLLLPFLRSSQHYSLDKAYEVCKKRNLVEGMVFILGRMGNTRDALSLIINKLKDMEQAILFVTGQHDDELWGELINQSLNNAEMVGALLEHTIGNIDPLHVINKVPLGMRIPQLRDRLVKIIADYRTEMSLRQGCNNILKADCVDLLVRYYHEARHAIRVGGPEGGIDVAASASNKPASKRISAAAGRTSSKALNTGRRSNVGGSGRCCICLDPVALQNVAVVAFFCTHAYHITCLNDTSSTARNAGEKASGTARTASGDFFIGDPRLDPRVGKGFSENGEAAGSSAPQGFEMRCILCTTAASAAKKRGEDNRQFGQAGLV